MVYQIRRNNILGEDLKIEIDLSTLTPIPLSGDYQFEAILTQGSMSAKSSVNVTASNSIETLALSWPRDRLTELFRAGTAVMHVFKQHKTTDRRTAIASGVVVFSGSSR